MQTTVSRDDPNLYPTQEGFYWSAFVQMEHQDIPHLWRASDMDYVLITAAVTIPTRRGPIIRTIPLFTLDKGTIRTESGVDLLKKIPLSSEAREQVAIEIEVVYLENHRALVAARKILDRITELAKPFMANYPEAARILESAVSIVGETADESTNKASSIKKVIDPEAVNGAADRSRDQSSLVAFFLMPIDLRTYRGAGSNEAQDTTTAHDCTAPKSIEHCGAYAWVNHLVPDTQDIVECDDKSGYLCVQPTPSKADPEANADTYLLSLGAEGLEIRGLILELIAIARLNIAVTDISVEQAKTIETSFKQAAETLPQCDRADRDCKADHDAYTAAWEAAYEAIRDILANAAVAKTKNAPAESAVEYRKDRIKTAVYLTVKFKRSDDVYDPLVLLPDARGDCTKLTVDAIDDAQEYFGANVDFFTERDANTVRMTLRLAREYVEIRKLVAEGSYVEGFRRVGELRNAMRTGQATVDGRHWGRLNHNMVYVSHCFEELGALPPTRQFKELWALYEEGFSETQGERLPRPETIKPFDSAERLDRIAHTLGELAELFEESAPDFSKSTPKEGLASKSHELSIVRLLYIEAAAIHRTQATRAALGIQDCAQANNDVVLYSIACKPCVEALEKACRGQADLKQLLEALDGKRLRARAARRAQ